MAADPVIIGIKIALPFVNTLLDIISYNKIVGLGCHKQC